MNMPRCGNKDRIGPETKRRKRYALQGSRWRVKQLTYKISKYPTRLTDDEVDKEVQRAFDVWTKYTPLTFTRKKSGDVHIDVRFERGEHGDGDPFDGRGGTLAHAYFPIYGGDAHFDDQEIWTINSYSGTNLFQVAAHEFGHSLGLSHSDVRDSLMAPFYREYKPSFELHQDDIRGIQALYGSKEEESGTPSTTTSAPSRPLDPRVGGDDEFCKSPQIDAIVTTKNGKTYAFKGSKYWELLDVGVASGYPRSISEGWNGVPNDIDAAFTWTNGKTYIFKGSEYWRLNNMDVDSGYPKPISQGFKGIPSDIDAAFVWSGNGKIYFFKGDTYYRFDPAKKPPVSKQYAGGKRKIKMWTGLPESGIDDAIQYTNGYTYFFKGDLYWRFNDKQFKVDDTSDPPYPRSVAKWWFNCDSGQIRTLSLKSGDEDTAPKERGDIPAGSKRDAGRAALREGGENGARKTASSAHTPVLFAISVLVWKRMI
ncbi:unnamed protein product [Cyprideis torosa]|uniref:Uncharacterized protein n=1 Tax=Cyprideis torosa TaxID=163714 RepID=A0A7R8ZJK7_9CRUS|nr:unnamed protein product [Cyprideis torosa]CAG0888863.1 unnamed protein product [Cyprideis torosa]